jgi:hypothetical protein
MTDRDHITWDMTEQDIREALRSVDALRHGLGDTMPTTAAGNRLTMAANALEQAIDYIHAARARMPKE